MHLEHSAWHSNHGEFSVKQTSCLTEAFNPQVKDLGRDCCYEESFYDLVVVECPPLTYKWNSFFQLIAKWYYKTSPPPRWRAGLPKRCFIRPVLKELDLRMTPCTWENTSKTRKNLDLGISLGSKCVYIRMPRAALVPLSGLIKTKNRIVQPHNHEYIMIQACTPCYGIWRCMI